MVTACIVFQITKTTTYFFFNGNLFIKIFASVHGRWMNCVKNKKKHEKSRGYMYNALNEKATVCTWSEADQRLIRPFLVKYTKCNNMYLIHVNLLEQWSKTWVSMILQLS